jgi:predicted nucleic acid-binding Zn ribbon protein
MRWPTDVAPGDLRLTDDDLQDQGAFWPDLAPIRPRCEVCGKPLDPDARSDARFCAEPSTCRVKAHRQRTRAHL